MPWELGLRQKLLVSSDAVRGVEQDHIDGDSVNVRGYQRH